jgi:hypothetical protein
MEGCIACVVMMAKVACEVSTSVPQKETTRMRNPFTFPFVGYRAIIGSSAHRQKLVRQLPRDHVTFARQELILRIGAMVCVSGPACQTGRGELQ